MGDARQHTKITSDGHDAIYDGCSKTLAVLAWTTAAITFFGLSVALANRALPNTAASVLIDEERVQARREGWRCVS